MAQILIRKKSLLYFTYLFINLIIPEKSRQIIISRLDKSELYYIFFISTSTFSKLSLTITNLTISKLYLNITNIRTVNNLLLGQKSEPKSLIIMVNRKYKVYINNILDLRINK